MSQALYRKYRSKSLAEIVGQDHITDILGRAIANQRIAHAYLLTGPRGVGKTSIARILAHEINSLPYSEESTHLDIIEIDAASNNGVEDVRDLREKANIAPSSAKFKVYIIDEVHMLSKAAFNALLKTLEEPPAHIVFILATTNVEKLPATILSRVQRFTFRTISADAVTTHLANIANTEKISISKDALALIAEHGEGSFRDSISILDQVSSLSSSEEEITREMIEDLLGLSSASTIADILSAYEAGNIGQITSILRSMEDRGLSAGTTTSQLIRMIRSQAHAKPQLLRLADKLLAVEKSSRPHVKLLTTLTLDLLPVAHAPTAQAPTAQAPATPPINNIKKPAAQKPKPVAAPATSTAPASQPDPTESAPPAPTPRDASNDQPFDWDTFIAKAKDHSIGTRDSLKKCTYTFDGKTLVLYAGTKFNKNVLESQKHMQEISKSLEEIGLGDIQVEILGEKQPPSDSQTAAIVAMMGGGEEVDAKI